MIKLRIPQVKSIILVASGKGGVGKSTVAANLSVALAKSKRVGLLDADIYGPSIPILLGINQKPEIDDNKRFIPAQAYGLQVISMGMLLEPGTPAIWRGPMVTKTLYQLIMQTAWQDLDYLVIDTPPGTGDVHLSLSEKFVIDGAVIVSTPQYLALIEAQKSINMLEKLGVKIIGLVKNMTGDKIFPESKEFKLNTDILGEIPIDPTISRLGDQGKPISGLPGGEVFFEIADRILKTH